MFAELIAAAASLRCCGDVGLGVFCFGLCCRVWTREEG